MPGGGPDAVVNATDCHAGGLSPARSVIGFIVPSSAMVDWDFLKTDSQSVITEWRMCNNILGNV